MFRHPLVVKPRGLTTWDTRSRKVMGRRFRNMSSPLPGANGHAKCLLYQRPRRFISDRQYGGRMRCLPGKETTLISCLFSQVNFCSLIKPSLKLFLGRVTDTTFADAELETTWNLPGNERGFLPIFWFTGYHGTGGKASGWLGPLRPSPAGFPALPLGFQDESES